MSQTHDNSKKRRTRSLALVLAAWVFIGGQALLAAGSIYNYNCVSTENEEVANSNSMPWELIGHGANRVRLIAMQGRNRKSSETSRCSWRSPTPWAWRA